MSDTTNGPGADPNDSSEEMSELTLLASAYLDGQATPDESVRVEASDELLAEVESLRQVRAVLGVTTEPPPISVREAHLASALDVWDRMSEREQAGEVTPTAGMDAAAGAAITTPPPTSIGARRDRRSRSSASRWLLGAAAGLVVLAGTGFVISNLDSTSDDQSDVAADAAQSSEEAASEAELVAREASDEFDGVEAESAPLELPADVAFDEDLRPADDSAAASQAADAGDDEQVDEADAMEEEPMDEAMEEEPAAGGEAEPFPAEIDLDPLQTLDELADLAAIAAYSSIDLESPVTTALEVKLPFPTCEDAFASRFTIDQYVGPASYRDELVIVGIDTEPEPDRVIAYRPDDCEVVAQTALPTLEEFEASRNGS